MNILIFYRHFPVAMGQYIKWALQELGHNVFSVGPYSNGKIPWGEQYYFPQYRFPPDLEIPDMPVYPLADVLDKARQKGFIPEMIFQASDNTYLAGKALVKNIIVGTDPHCVDYKPALKDTNYYICMQKVYMLPEKRGFKQYWMPYGYDKNIHKYQKETEIKYDVVFCGLQYPQRIETLKLISQKGWRVYNGLGLIYEEYVDLYNQGMIAFNWSSQQDLPARFWEGMAMRRAVLTNRVPDLAEFDLEEGVDYLGFSSMEEAVEKADFYLKRPKLLFKIGTNAWCKARFQKHHWAARLKKLIDRL